MAQDRSVYIALKLRDEASKAFINATNGMLFNLAKFTGGALSVAGLVNTMKSAVNEAMEAEKATAALTSALRAQGLSIRENLPRLTGQAEALSKVSLASDEAIQGAQKLLISVGGLTGAGLDRATAAALDLSVGLGIDLTQAAEMLAKAANGAVVPFSKLGVEFDKSATDGEKFAKVMDFVQKRFGGAAAAEIDTMAGSLHELSEAMSELGEATGRAALGGKGGVQTITEFLRGIRVAVDQKGFGALLTTNPQGLAATIAGAPSAGSRDTMDAVIASRFGQGGITSESDSVLAEMVKRFDAIAKSELAADEAAKKYAETLSKLKDKAGDFLSVSAPGKERSKDLLAIDPKASLGWVDGYVKAAEEALKLSERTNGLADAWIALQRPVNSVEEAWERIADVQRILEEHSAEWTPELEALANTLVEMGEHAQSLGVQLEQTLINSGANAAMTFGDAMIDAAAGAGVEWDKLLKGILVGLVKAQLQALIFRAIFGAATGGAGFGVGGAASADFVGMAAGWAKGGVIPHPVYAASGLFTPRGTDIVPAMLTPGEMVLPRRATESILAGRASLVGAGSASDDRPQLLHIQIGEATLARVLIRNGRAVEQAIDAIDARRF